MLRLSCIDFLVLCFCLMRLLSLSLCIVVACTPAAASKGYESGCRRHGESDTLIAGDQVDVAVLLTVGIVSVVQTMMVLRSLCAE
jgi:hypothetical protein